MSFADLDALRWVDILERTPGACRFDELVDAAAERPELRLVLDMKSRFNEAYDHIEARVRPGGMARSFIPQIYHFSEVRRFRENPGFAGALFTAYRSGLATDRIFEYAEAAGIPVVTLPV